MQRTSTALVRVLFSLAFTLGRPSVFAYTPDHGPFEDHEKPKRITVTECIYLTDEQRSDQAVETHVLGTRAHSSDTPAIRI